MDPNPRTSFALTADQVDSDGRSWIEVMPVADKARNGRWYFTVTADDLEAYAESIRAQAGKIPVDYDHEGADGGSSRAAGWFTGQAKVGQNDAGQPVLLAEVEWTPRAQDEIRNGEFRFISPEFSFANRDTKSGLMTKAKDIIAATLTNRPFFKQLAPVTASELLDSDQVDALAAKFGREVADLVLTAGADPDQLRAKLAVALADPEATPDSEASEDADPDNTTASQEDTQMSENSTTDFLALLGLDDTADPDQRITAAFKHLRDENITLREQVTDLNAKLSEADKLNDRIAQLEQRDRDRDIEVVLTKAISDGRVLPSEKEMLAKHFSDNVAGLREVVASKPMGYFTPKAIGHGSSYGLEDPDIAEVAKDFRGQEPVDPDSAKQHVVAMRILKERGKETDYTADEYVAACHEAERELARAA